MDNDPANPLCFDKGRKWLNAMILAIAVWTVSIASSGFSQGNTDIETEFDVDGTIALMVTSAFVLGFAAGALVLSPMSEVFGRKSLYLYTYAAFVVLSGVIGLVHSIELVIFLRFLGGLAGSFTQAVAPAVIADMFATNERGFVLAFFTLAGLMGQMLGPIFCGFLDAAFGWRSLAVFIACLAAPTWIAMMCTFPETYAPALLRQRAAKMEAILGKPHLVDGVGEEKTVASQLKVGAIRPFLLLFLEPIVALLTLFLSVVQGTMFLLFAAYPIVFQQTRGWHQGVASLPFLAVALGIVIALFYSALFDQKRYAKVVDKNQGRAPPEARLPPAMLGAICLPVGLFWFAWTNSPSTFWLISVSAGVFIGFGMVLLYMSLTNYIVDAYLGYAASALAATTVVRSGAAAAFPLFTSTMYDQLGIHWASSVPGFMSVIFVPALLAFYKWGHIIRSKTRFAAEAARLAEAMSGGK
ncbi:MFS general substrate transporter [Cryphonectria parasitica EP155]|uniref:MFS general substrate transporter n=1 Tax=Cryphonectria parasitica (strain ATCC 38755 / EP155) TaxID=660469 RepID=A0A9P4Y2L2_CRYP1|nr:MFS general substrate transporter [Cryphonectria parasitica EP155]KAF3765338.1 MFS general substrate transporter [Cryphonectria parasitica EP155]